MRDVAGQQSRAVILCQNSITGEWYSIDELWYIFDRAEIRSAVNARIADGQLTGEAEIAGRRVRWSVPAEEGKATQ